MAKTRTTVALDEELMTRAKRITKLDSPSDILERALKEMIRRDSLNRMADAILVKSAEDDAASAAPRRRPS